MMQPSFALTETFALGGEQYSWRLKESEIRFRGTGRFEKLVLRRISVSLEQVESFFAAIDLLEVWEWRDDYHVDELGYDVQDGSWWTFSATDANRSCRCGGGNAFPSYADPKQTSLVRGRFALLHRAMYDCFGIEQYIREAERFAKREAELRGEQSGS